ncbi:PspC domain-containing protein [Actinomyces sp. W5033]|uniref:PspC domain-containing protein n=1 Tax=Actinomyces sp. W5033 TaxID=3446479 RepID=UPI003EE28C84
MDTTSLPTPGQDDAPAQPGPAQPGSYQRPFQTSYQAPYQQHQGGAGYQHRGPYPPDADGPSVRRGPLRSFFASVRRTGLFRSQERWVAGVAGGLARRLDLDPVLVRCVWVVLMMFSGLGLVLYGLAWALLPEEHDGRIHLEQVASGDISAGLAGAVVAFITGCGLGGRGLFPVGTFQGWSTFSYSGLSTTVLWTGIIVLVLWALTRRHQAPQAPQPGEAHAAPQAPHAGTPEGTAGAAHAGATFTAPTTPVAASTAAAPVWQAPAPPRQRVPGPGRTLSLLVLALVMFSLAAVGWATTSGRLGPLSALVACAGVLTSVLGAGVVISAFLGRRGGWMSVFGFMTLMATVPSLAVGSVIGSVGALNGPVPHHAVSVVVTDAMVAGSGGHLDLGGYGVGSVTIDLTGLSAQAARGATIGVSVGAGEVVVRTHQGQAVTVNAQVGAGEVSGDLAEAWQSTGVEQQHKGYAWAPGHLVDGQRLVETRLHADGLEVRASMSSPAAQAGGTAEGVQVRARVGAGSVRVAERHNEVTWSGWVYDSYWVIDSWREPEGGEHDGSELPVPGMTFPAVSSDDVSQCTGQIADERADDLVEQDEPLWGWGPENLGDMPQAVRAQVDACVLRKIEEHRRQLPHDAGQQAPPATPTPTATPAEATTTP